MKARHSVAARPLSAARRFLRPGGAKPPQATALEADEQNVEVESLKDQGHTAHEEARMVLPGIQALFGFQLIAVFNQRFSELEAIDRVVYLVSLMLVAIAIGLIMAPAAYHRLVEPDRVSGQWLRLASKDIAWAMAALTPAIAIDVYLVAVMTTGNGLLGIALAASMAAFLTWFWFARPLLRQREQNSRQSNRGTSKKAAM